MSEIIEKIIKLKQQIAKYDEAYHTNDSPLISDAQYDEIKKKLIEYEKLYPELFKEQTVGGKTLDIFKKIKHSKPMLSLANAFNREDIDDFIERLSRFLGIEKSQNTQNDLFSNNQVIEIFAEVKIDGLSFSARYENGKLVYCSTRGDGIEGEDVTENIKTIDSFPTILKVSNPPRVLEVRGEIYMNKKDFEELNKKQEEKNAKIFANPRNAAAGSLRQLDPSITSQRKLSYFAYSIGEFSNDFTCSSQSDFHRKLKEYGFTVEPNSKICNSIDEMIDHHQKIADIRYKLDYDLDGLVYKVNSFSLQNRLGYIAKSPRYAIAHKFPSEKAKTIIEDIIIQVGRTGVLTPVAILKPVNIGGVVVSRATLHNQDEIARKDIRINDLVLIQRAGDVIPQVVEVEFNHRNFDSKPFIFPDNCPVCNSKIVKNDEDVALRCSGGLGCEAQLKETLKHFVCKDAFDINGLGKKQIENFFIEGRIKSFADIFKLEENDKINNNSLRNKSGWGDKSVDNLFFAINQKRTISLEKFIYAIGIRHVGESIAKLIAGHFRHYDNFFSFMLKYSKYSNEELINNNSEEMRDYQDFIAIDGIGQKMAFAIFDYFRDQRSLKMLQDLSPLLLIEEYSIVKIFSDLAGKSIVFTGTLEKMSRAEAKKRAEELGMKVVNSVSAKTDYIVCGENSGSKLKRAKELNLNILNEEQWLKLIS
jgi:DNA ligase (NAD+)